MRHNVRRVSQVVVVVLLLAMMLVGASAQEASELPLAEPGPYNVGLINLNFVDNNRDNQINNVIIWYPATSSDNLIGDILITQSELSLGSATLIRSNSSIKETASRRAGNLGNVVAGSIIDVISIEDDWAQIEYGDITGWVNIDDYVNISDADASQAPYPLIIYSHNVQGHGTAWESEGLMEHLASQGFVVATINHNCGNEPRCAIDRQLDVFFVIDQLANLNDGHLQGMIDGNNVGVMGFGMGGHTVLGSVGARTDPEFLLNTPSNYYTKYVPFGINIGVVGFNLNSGSDRVAHEFSLAWTEISDYLTEIHGINPDGLYPEMSDERIHAALAITPWLNSMYGPVGVDAISTPTLVIPGLHDGAVPYEQEIASIYTGWANDNRQVVTVTNLLGEHAVDMTFVSTDFNHLATAWFGYYLQGHEEYQEYLTADYFNASPDMVWGLVETEE